MKKIVYVIIAVVILGGIILVFADRNKDQSEFVTAFVDIGAVAKNVDATGSVVAAEDIELNFRTTGRIESINVSEGEQVKAGQVLAVLEAGALHSQVKDAESVLIEAQANLKKLLAGATEGDIRISEITVEQKGGDFGAKRNDLESLISKSLVELKNLKNTAIVDLNNELIVAETAMEVVDNTLNNEDAGYTLGVLDSMSVPLAQESQSEAGDIINEAKILIKAVDEGSSDEQTLNAIEVVKNALEKTRECLSSVFFVLENTIISNNLTQTELDALITGIQSEQVKISTARNNIYASQSNWTNKQVYYNEQILKARDAVDAAGDAFDLAKAQLEFKTAEPEDYEIDAYNAKIAKTEANLVLAQSKLSDAIIKAPVNGVVIKINNKVGEQTSLALAVVEMIGEAKLEIDVNIPESDIAKIRIGQMADITLDSFGDDNVFPGFVIFVDPAETIIQDVVYYQVKVHFKDDVQGIKHGMTANTVIETDKKENVLRVPLRAVKQKNGDKIVTVLRADKTQEEKNITVGLRGDDYIEILNGLEKGDTVITFVNDKQK
ncbi:hypothetical protein COT27_01950 [Candidatus Kuenenbacteria bacterium CG08_land_8_20_14_0_20_37_23]|uniref:Uncharacterized protein n=1 Tax=Candidatus Kuenenbacteria bacterium CG08_land_8_20_14_0_20_37_23 TaxID=1974617 RepID=A0A2M6XSQ4_9BACT|nr:MAG: hypothetical protein COT27_01950 [Candidatus Kuenenbacteria bacterium CG08_land_8_20_14_0_20_37_23]